MKLLDLFYELAAKCGKQNDPAVIDLLSRSDLQCIAVADPLANTMIAKLLTVESAKNNKTVKKHFTALALAAVDAEIMNGIRALRLGEDFEKEISLEPNTYEKQRKLIKRIQSPVNSHQ